jgi:hypothetical protein
MGKMIGCPLMAAIASITWRLNSFGTVLTPMMPCTGTPSH